MQLRGVQIASRLGTFAIRQNSTFCYKQDVEFLLLYWFYADFQTVLCCKKVDIVEFFISNVALYWHLSNKVLYFNWWYHELYKDLAAVLYENKGNVFDAAKMAEDDFSMIPYKTLLKILNWLQAEGLLSPVSKGVYQIITDKSIDLNEAKKTHM